MKFPKTYLSLFNSSDFEAFVQFQRDIGEYFNKKYRIPSKYGQKVAKHLFNSVEDGRIEKIHTNKLPGQKKHIQFLNGTFWEHQEMKGSTELEDFLYTITSFSVTGLYPKGFKKIYKGTDLHKNMKKIEEDIYKGIDGVTCKQCVLVCHEIIQKVEDYLAKLLKERNQQMEEFLRNIPDKSEWTTSEEQDKNTGSDSPHFIPRKNKEKNEEEKENQNQNQNGEESTSDSNAEKENKEEKGKGKGKKEEDKEDNNSEDKNGTGSTENSTNDESDEETKNGSKGNSDDENESESDSEGNSEKESDEDSDGDSDENSKGDKEDNSNEESDENTDEFSTGNSDNEESDSESDSDSENDSDSNSQSDQQQDSNEDKHDSDEIPESTNEYPKGMSQNDDDEDMNMDEDIIREHMKEITDKVIEEAKNKIQEDKSKKKSAKKDGNEGITQEELKELENRYKNQYKKGFKEIKGFRNSYSLPEEIKREGKRFRKEVEKIFQNKESYNLRAQRKGVLDTSNLWKFGIKDYNMFMKKGTPITTDYVAFILQDGSGSMEEDGKEFFSAKAMAVIEEGLKGIIPFKMSTFSTESIFSGNGNAIIHYTAKDWKDNQFTQNYSYNLHRSRRASGGNKDGYSIRVAMTELMKRPEKDKILIVLSDGLPSDYNKGYSEGMVDVKEAVREARKKGIHVISLLFGTERFRNKNIDNYKYMYDKNIISSEPEQITNNMVKMLKKIISR